MKNVALITGSYGGLGKCFAEIHAKHGGDLILVGRNLDKLNEQASLLKQKYSINVETIVADLTKSSSIDNVYNTVKQNNWTIDYLINNAGFGGQGDFATQRSVQDDMNMVAVNVEAVTRMCKLFLPDMVNKKNGRVLNVSSIASLVPGPLMAVYYATKAYVTSFSNALWRELKGTGVTITALMPGAMETGFAKTGGLLNTKLFAHTLQPMKVAEKGYKAMLKGKLNVKAGLGFIGSLVNLAKITPKKIVLNIVYNLQKVKK